MGMIFMTGLSGAGKTTLANGLKTKLKTIGVAIEVFDGDIFRNSVSKDLGYSVAKAAYEQSMAGTSVIVAAINPFEDLRVQLREQYNAKIIWVNCALAELISRDPKGLYRRALLQDGHPEKIKNLTGINDPYEIPVNPDLIIDTSNAAKEKSIEQLFNYVTGILNPGHPKFI
jgi:adenylylsulfate kinase